MITCYLSSRDISLLLCCLFVHSVGITFIYGWSLLGLPWWHCSPFLGYLSFFNLIQFCSQVIGGNKGGVVALVEGLKGFVPFSQVSSVGSWPFHRSFLCSMFNCQAWGAFDVLTIVYVWSLLWLSFTIPYLIMFCLILIRKQLLKSCLTKNCL